MRKLTVRIDKFALEMDCNDQLVATTLLLLGAIFEKEGVDRGIQMFADAMRERATADILAGRHEWKITEL